MLLLSLIVAFWRCINLGQIFSFLFNWFTIVLCNDVIVATMKFRSYDDSLGACSSGDRDMRSTKPIFDPGMCSIKNSNGSSLSNHLVSLDWHVLFARFSFKTLNNALWSVCTVKLDPKR